MKTLIVAVLVFGISIVFAQDKGEKSPVDQGVIEISGGITYLSSSSIQNDKSTGIDDPKWDNSVISFLPQVSYYIMDNLSVGAIIEYSSYKSEIEDYTLTNTTSSYGPIVKYSLNLDTYIYPYASIAYIIGSGTDETESVILGRITKYKRESDISNLKIGVGLDYFVSRNVSLRPFVEYDILTTETTDKKTEMKGLTIGIAIGAFIY